MKTSALWWTAISGFTRPIQRKIELPKQLGFVQPGGEHAIREFLTRSKNIRLRVSAVLSLYLAAARSPRAFSRASVEASLVSRRKQPAWERN